MSRQELLDAVASEIIVCVKCRLSQARKNAVPGEGNLDSKVILVGEAPGRWEDLKGRPFVGSAGKLLDSLLAEAGFSREHVFICNIVRCRPPENRSPFPDEIKACTPYLERQIDIIKPRLIVTLGHYSTSYVFSKANLLYKNITDAHGKFYEAELANMGMTVSVFPTYHPAAALYSAKYRMQLEKDFDLLKDWRRKT